MPKHLHLACAVLALAIAVPSFANDKIFADDFDRDDAKKPDNGWALTAEYSGAAIEDGALVFQPEDAEFEPNVSHTFPAQSEPFTVSFAFEWEREYEQVWAVYLQLGSSKDIPKKIESNEDMYKGIAVNLAWGGDYEIGHDGEYGILAHVKDGKFNKLAIIQDKEAEKTVLTDTTMTIDVDPKAGTYSVTVGDKTYKDLAFDNKVPIDTIRFIAHKVNPSNFTSMAIDDVEIVKKKK